MYNTECRHVAVPKRYAGPEPFIALNLIQATFEMGSLCIYSRRGDVHGATFDATREELISVMLVMNTCTA